MHFILALGLFYFCDAAFPISGQHYAINVQNQISMGTNGIVYGKVDTESFHRHGWYKLHISTNTNAVSDQQLAYSAGYLEGVLMNQQIFEGFATFAQSSGGIMQSSHIQNFVSQQMAFVESNIKTNKTAYWTHVDITLSQLRGIYAGYNANVTIKAHNISWIDFVMFQMEDELGDILQSFSTEDEVEQNPIRSKFDEHCSVLVRLNSNGSALFASHDTWSGFGSMLRVYKYYNFNFAAPMTSAVSIGFSGYPGTLVSSDDYYTTHPSNLVVMETTNDVFVQSLYSQFVTTQTVPFWLRIAVANRISKGGAEWAQNFAYYNSGTYNNQYQIVDYKLFKPYKPLANNLLWIVEQIPGYVVSADMTSTLRTQGFWPSYNIPYFPFIYNTSGYPQQHGNEFSYSMCARAQIFRRDAGKVEHMHAMKAIMRYNNYQNDPLSLKDACKQISARCDLNTPWSQNTLNGFSAFGAIDCKVTDNTLLPLQQSEIVCGPTWDDQPPFAWTRQWNCMSSDFSRFHSHS